MTNSWINMDLNISSSLSLSRYIYTRRRTNLFIHLSMIGMMNNHCILYFILLLLLALFDSTVPATPNCPVEGRRKTSLGWYLKGFSLSLLADPTTILSCVAIDAVGLVQATKGNIRAFCTMAERFMECLKTKTRGCFGEDVSQSIDKIRIDIWIYSSFVDHFRNWLNFLKNVVSMSMKEWMMNVLS